MMAEQTASAGYIADFKAKARAWALEVVELTNTPVTGELAGEKERLLSFANYIKKGIETIFGTIDELTNVGLGIVFPLVPVAVVAASLAAMYKWNRDYVVFKMKVKEQRRLEATGLDPVTASKIAAKKSPGLFSFSLRDPIFLVVSLGAAYWLFNNSK